LRTIRKDNSELAHVLVALRKAGKSHAAPLWFAVAEKLARPRRQSKPVNVGHLERLARPKETVVVPGKLLAHGSITKPLTVAAFHYSEDARAKIHAAGGTALSIADLLKAKPDGTGVRLLA
ncbi:MAG TPA: 50S ribosomal protein L18e, partial [Thermoplasmata archaeon]|nr:50S ribosomal protein L18e [Thermoplasmata archaeon]